MCAATLRERCALPHIVELPRHADNRNPRRTMWRGSWRPTGREREPRLRWNCGGSKPPASRNPHLEHAMADALRLAQDLIAIDSRSQVSNLAVADRVRQELAGFDVEVVDYTDAAGVPKRNLVARRGPDKPAVALSGHLDTVPDTGWTKNPFDPAI